MEVRLSPQPSSPFPYAPHEVAMNENGYYSVKSSPANKDLEQSLSAKEYASLVSSPESAKSLGSADYQLKRQWQKFMEYGINLDVALLSHLGTTRGVFLQGPVLASSIGNTVTGPKRAHPCRSAISVWRSIGPEHGLFKVYPGSHRLSTGHELQKSQIQAVDIRIPAEYVLFTHGGLWIEEGSIDGLLLWMGISTEIIGLHIDQNCPTFVALAHGAERFLSRREPPEIQVIPESEISQLILRQSKPSSRSFTAEQLLQSILASFPQIIGFIEKLRDPTGLILQKYCTDTATFLSVGYDTDPEGWFLRVLVVRYLTKLCRSRRETVTNFIQSERLPDTAQNAISNGQKVDWLEQRFENPGIWLALMGVFSRLCRLSNRELSKIEDLNEYRQVLERASEWSQLVVNCSRLYSTLVLGL